MKTLETLRDQLKKQKLAAVIVPGTDPHGSEYIADHWQERQFISGFTGSAGTVVVTTDKAALWTDSRYFLQGADQLANSGIDLMKDGLPDTPNITTWLKQNLKPGEKVAINAEMCAINEQKLLSQELAQAGLVLETSFDLISPVWNDRPPLPHELIMVLDEKFAGRSVSDKLAAVRKKMSEAGIDVLPLSMLDDIAWLFNIRGKDIEYNPVVISYAMVTQKTAIIFIDEAKLTDEAKTYFTNAKVEIQPYTAIFDTLANLDENIVVGMDFKTVNYKLYSSVPNVDKIKDFRSPITAMKGVKNEVELAGFHKAMVRDGVALVQFFHWLEKAVPKGGVTELSAAAKLHEYRAKQKHFFSESFGTIAAYGTHGAIVHYEPEPETDVELKPESFFLLDSGGQYLDGTTDITRTISLGKLTKKEKRDFTLVLKGHLALSNIKYPYGTRGVQLDVLARQYLWNDGLQYGHGTGHGVGHFLCVHEGPQSIRMNENPVVLEPGMITSNEPGLYLTGEYGIRTENLVLTVEDKTTDFGHFLKFETLTLCPYDTRAIDKKLLTRDEISQVNNYHSYVYKKLSPKLDKLDRQWLEKKCKKI